MITASEKVSAAEQMSRPAGTSPELADELEELTDQDLLQSMADGNKQALSDLYDRYSGLMFSQAARMLGQTQRAEEVLQEVFLYVWRRAASYDPARASVSTWISLITRSRAVDRLRSSGKRHDVQVSYRRENPSASVASESFSRAFARERSYRVRQALGLLPDPQRQVIEMCYYGGLSQQEVSQTLGIPLGTVKTRCHLALRKLRTALAPEIGELI